MVRRRRAGPGWGVGELSAEDRAHVREAVSSLPAMTEEQIAGVCEVINVARRRWRRTQNGTE